MSPPNSEQQRSSRQLLGLNGERRSAQQCAQAAKQLGEQLRLRLAPLIGSAGFDAMFARSVHLATSTLPASARSGFRMELTARAQEELGSFLAEQDPVVAAATATAVFATFFALMTTFIGDKLTEKVLSKIGLPGTAPSQGERS